MRHLFAILLGLGASTAIAAEEQAPRWSFVVGAGVAAGSLKAESDGGEDPSLDPGLAYGFSVERLGQRFGIGFESSGAHNDAGTRDEKLDLDHYLVNGIVLAPVSERIRLSASLGVGAFRHELNSRPDETRWSPGGQLALHAERRFGARNWLGLRGRLRYAAGIEGDFGDGFGDHAIDGTDAVFTFRRSY